MFCRLSSLLLIIILHHHHHYALLLIIIIGGETVSGRGGRLSQVSRRAVWEIPASEYNPQNMAAEYGRLGFCTIVHSSLQCTNVLQCWIWQNGDSLNASVHRSLQCTSVHTTQNMAAEYARLRILCNCTLQRHHQAEKYFKIHKNTRLTYHDICIFSPLQSDISAPNVWKTTAHE